MSAHSTIESFRAWCGHHRERTDSPRDHYYWHRIEATTADWLGKQPADRLDELGKVPPTGILRSARDGDEHVRAVLENIRKTHAGGNADAGARGDSFERSPAAEGGGAPASGDGWRSALASIPKDEQLERQARNRMDDTMRRELARSNTTLDELRRSTEARLLSTERKALRAGHAVERAQTRAPERKQSIEMEM